ncbi:zincin-like metallopeptidase domain-containing protein, partial [Bradyrhizobium sp. Bra64]|uniref:zincin-like metallopeptidase domain-containing protein n=1 Tax=Bradyrhizobium sp. Bra64 TaxID=2926009 RepID=UPI002118854E
PGPIAVTTSELWPEDSAYEELVAELGSAFICAHFGYSYIEAQSPAYIEGWLKVLEADNRAVFSIASYASQAADWLLQKGHGVDETKPAVEQPKEYARSPQ